MNRVAASEADQLTVARALMGQETVAAAEGVVRRWRNMPSGDRYRNKIGPTAMDLLKSTLARGSILQLAKRGGWQSRRFAGGDHVLQGRLWDRHPAQSLRFSSFSFKLIRWLTEAPIARTDCPILEPVHQTPGDELLMYLAVDLCRKMDCGDTLAKQAAFRRSGLVWLGFPDVLAHHGVGVPVPAMFDRLLERPAVVILEALAPDISARWSEIELKKRFVVGGQEMIRLGATQAAVAHCYLGAIDSHHRRDLAQCFLEAGERVLEKSATPEGFAARLEQRGRVAERARARSAAGAFLRVLEQLGRWAEEARAVRFFEDDFDTAQLFLLLYERLGDHGVRRAQEIVRELDALDAGVAATATGESS